MGVLSKWKAGKVEIYARNPTRDDNNRVVGMGNLYEGGQQSAARKRKPAVGAQVQGSGAVVGTGSPEGPAHDT